MAIHSLNWQDLAPPSCRQGAVAIGNFDGAHRGHAALLAETHRLAQALGGPAVAVTFDPHPIVLLRPEQAPPLLTSRDDRAALLHAAGIDEVVILQATPDLLRLGAREFFEAVVRAGLAARGMVEGAGFVFGRGREGDMVLLAVLCREAGIDCVAVPPVLLAGRAVSSSAVRAALDAGQVREAAELLDRPYRLRGKVVPGQRRGQGLGFPTANLGAVETLVPAGGVYAARALVADQAWPAAVNIGPNPTFGEGQHKIEAHLIGFQGDLYGQPLALDFIERLRATRPFRGVEELRAQLGEDVAQARALVGPSAPGG